MAVTRAEKEQALQDLSSAFQSVDTAILVDYKGLDVPGATELRRQLRSAKAQYRVVKNTLAKRATKGTRLESLEKHFEGTTAIAYTNSDAVALAKALTTFIKATPKLVIKAAVVQGQAIQPAAVNDLADAAWQTGTVFEVVVLDAGADAAAGDGVVRNAAQPGDGAERSSEKEGGRIVRLWALVSGLRPRDQW